MAGITESRTFDSLLTTTLSNYREKMVDNIFETNPLLSYFNGKLGKALNVGRGRGSVKRVLSGGESIVEHLIFETNSTVDSYSGNETLDTTLQEGHTIARFNWKQYAGTIGITGLEKRNNSGKEQLINLLQAKTDQTIMSLKQRLNEDSFGDGTGNSGKNLGGLQNIVSATATSGGLNPGTFPWWVAQATTGGSFASQGLSDMSTTYNNASDGNDSPDFIITTQSIYEFYETALQPIQRIANAATGEAGFKNLAWRGMPVVWDRDCPSGNMYMLNSNYINWSVHKDADFAISPFVSPEDQDSTTAKVIFQGNITVNNRRRHAVITSISA